MWNVKEFEKILKMIEEYKHILPEFLKDYLLNSIILPKIIEGIDSWEPTKDTSMIHNWIFPW